MTQVVIICIELNTAIPLTKGKPYVKGTSREFCSHFPDNKRKFRKAKYFAHSCTVTTQRNLTQFFLSKCRVLVCTSAALFTKPKDELAFHAL